MGGGISAQLPLSGNAAPLYWVAVLLGAVLPRCELFGALSCSGMLPARDIYYVGMCINDITLNITYHITIYQVYHNAV